MKVPSGVGEGFKRCSPINPTLSLTADNGQNKKKEIEIMFIWNRNEQLNICWLDADAGSVDFVIMCLYLQRAETNFWIPHCTSGALERVHPMNQRVFWTDLSTHSWYESFKVLKFEEKSCFWLKTRKWGAPSRLAHATWTNAHTKSSPKIVANRHRDRKILRPSGR